VRISGRKSPSGTARPFASRRITGLAILTAAVAAAVVYLQVGVPLAGPGLPRAQATAYWPVAVIAGVVVLVGSIAVAWLSLGAMKRRE
jgi:hypothetical protein